MSRIINKSLVGFLFVATAFVGAALVAGCAIDSTQTDGDKQDEAISESVNNIVQGDIGSAQRGNGNDAPGSEERDPTPIAEQSRPYAPQPQPWVQQLAGESNGTPQPQPWVPPPSNTSPTKH